MEALWLRGKDGGAIGPITRAALEVLFDAHVVDASTPVSANGREYAPLGQAPGLLEHLERVSARWAEGEEPWPEAIQVRATTPASGGRSALPRAFDTTLGLLVDLALRRSTGDLELPGPKGATTLSYRDGKIVAVEASDPELAFATWLVEHGVVSAEQVERARAQAPALGGDLGGALVASGALAPNLYFEKLVAWATVTVGRCILRTFAEPRFEPRDVKPPAIPLGFDRFGLLFEGLREAADRATLERRLHPKRGCPLIPSQVEGLTVEDVKPKPRELRALNAVNGARTLGDLLDELGGSDERSRDVLRAVLFATEAGLMVFGRDPLVEREQAEAKQLDAEIEAFRKKTLFQRLGATEKSTDEEVRAQFAELAKRLHPDGLRPECAPELRAARQRFFALAHETAEALATSSQRYAYAQDLERGLVDGSEEQERKAAAAEAATLFKKAEILLRMKKYAEAMAHVDEALRRSPGDAELRIFRIYAAHLDAARGGTKGPTVQDAIRDILAVMRFDANIPRGYLYLGYLHKAVDKPDIALKYFKKVLEYEENHPEAEREVRLATARREKESKKKRWGL